MIRKAPTEFQYAVQAVQFWACAWALFALAAWAISAAFGTPLYSPGR